MESVNKTGRWLAAGGAAVLLAGGVALWVSADAQKVHANVPAPPPVATDEDADGALDPGEPLLAAPAARTKSKEEKRFARVDRNDDGRITQSEFLANRRRNFDKLDVNGDGVLSFAEYAASGIAKFNKADGNGDGILTASEFATTAPKPAKKASARALTVCLPGQQVRAGSAPAAAAADADADDAEL